MFTKVDLIIEGAPGLINAIKSLWTIDGEVLEETLFNDLKEYLVDSNYIDSKYSNDLDIAQELIYHFDENDPYYYRFWRTVGLTELQETYIETQAPELTNKIKVEKEIWV